MTTCVAVTGAGGFVGRHLCLELERRPDVTVVPVMHEPANDALMTALGRADIVFHLAGANRPADPSDYARVNTELTRTICDRLATRGAGIPVILASSTQAGNGTPYGDSKLAAERVVEDYAARGGRSVVFRFPNLFGKWCRPRYNSAVATFAHAIARGESYEVHDADRQVTLLHVADAVAALARCLDDVPAVGTCDRRQATPTSTIRLGDLIRILEGFAQHRQTLCLPDYSDSFVRALYSTYVSFLDSSSFSYDLLKRTDARGTLAEFLKSSQAGQIFVSRTKPGITRGNHWHETKVEKFFVVAGEAVIRFRSVANDEVIAVHVRGEDFRVVDIPPGYAHSIENVGTDDLVTLFWADEIFDPARPDTWSADVGHGR